PAWTDEFPAGDGYGSGQGHHRSDTCVCNQHWDTEELRKATLTQTLRGVRLTHTHTHTHTPTQTHTHRHTRIEANIHPHSSIHKLLRRHTHTSMRTHTNTQTHTHT